MKKEWWIVGGTGLACIGVWMTLLFTVFTGDEMGEQAAEGEEESSLTSFYKEEFEEINEDEEPDSKPAEAGELNQSEKDSTGEKQEIDYTLEAPVEIEDLNLERIQEDGLEVDDVKLISPDQSMSIDEILEVLIDLEENFEQIHE